MADSKRRRDADKQDLAGRGKDSSNPDSPTRTDKSAEARKAAEAKKRRRTGRWRPSNWRLRWKLAMVMLIPAITAIALGAFRVQDQVSSLRAYQQANQNLALAGTLSTVVDNLQIEREQGALVTASKGGVGTAAFGSDTNNVNSALTRFRQQLAAAKGLDGGTAKAMQNASTALNGLASLRGAVTNNQSPEIGVINQYSSIIQTLIHSEQSATLGVTDQRLYAQAVGLDQLRLAKESYSVGNALLLVAAQEKSFPPTGLDNFQASQSRYQALFDELTSDNSVTGEQISGQATSLPADQRSQLAQTAISQAEQNQQVVIDVTATQKAGDQTTGSLRTLEQGTFSRLDSLTGQLASQARTAAMRDTGIILGALLLAFIITLTVARSVLRALRTLRAGALNIARNRLPENVERILADPDPIAASNTEVEPVPVFSTDEIGEVARSFDVVHSQALRLAAVLHVDGWVPVR